MKIVYLSKAILPSRYANSIQIMKMCDAFSELGHDVTLIAPKIKNRKDENYNSIHEFYGTKSRFNIIKLPYLGIKGKNLSYSLLIALKLLRLKPDIVYGRYDIGCLMAAYLGFNCSYEMHQALGKDNLLMNKIYSGIAKNKNINKIIVISDELKNIIYSSSEIFRETDKLLVAHDAAESFEIQDSDPAILKGNSDHLKVGYVGNLYRGKGIEVIENIAHKLNDVDFHIVGGFDDDIEFWKNRINRKNVFFYGFKEQSKIGGYIMSFDVCILPNQKKVSCQKTNVNIYSDIGSYTSPLKLFEYMAYQKAIIASDLPTIREVLDHNIDSILVGHEDFAGWVNAIDKLKDYKLRQNLSANAYKKFKREYTWKIRAEKIINGIFTESNKKRLYELNNQY